MLIAYVDLNNNAKCIYLLMIYPSRPKQDGKHQIM